MEKRVLYTLWMQSCIGYANPYVMQIINTFETSEQIYSAGERELRISGLFTKGQLNKLLNKDLDPVKRIYERAVQAGVRIVTISSGEYPASLRRIPDPPLLLFIKGKLPAHRGLKVAVVGTREPTRLGRQVAYDLSYELTRNKALIISGGAEGIDIQAHKGALTAGGQTICVLGNGLEANYLRKYAGVRDEIAQHGAVISEYPVDMTATPFSFPQRNRIVVGIADCTLVVEGGLDSGSLVSASKAAEQHKMVFAVPGSLDNKKALGPNYLLTKGARAVVRSQDIIEWYDTRRSADDISPPVLNQRVIDSARSITKQRMNEAERYSSLTESDAVDSGKDYERIQEDPVSARKKIQVAPHPEQEIKEQTAPETDSAPEWSYRSPGKNSIRKPKAESIKRFELLETSTADIPESQDKTAILHEKNDNTSSKTEKTDSDLLTMLTKPALTVYHTISETPKAAEMIAAELGMSATDVLTALSELEMFGLAEVNGYGIYHRK
ncbi:MAG: DNA-processing protein DprA [Clostridia bacterium]|nr:DNA-processing protein DprA [Clostridia bacterium]